MTRALMEGVAFSLKDSLEIIRDIGVLVEQVRAVGGGARSALWRSLQADIYGEPIKRARADEGPAYGAALLGEVACGAYQDVEEAASRVVLREEVTEPDPKRVALYAEYHDIYRSLYAANKDAMHRLSR